MDNCQRIWEQELYNGMIYKTPTSTFHTFEGDSTTVGLSFADNREAEEFKAAVIERYLCIIRLFYLRIYLKPDALAKKCFMKF